MSDQFVGEIRAFAGNFAPTGWALCNGQLLPISQNTALFSLLGTQYGGDGRTNFALPNLQERSPIGAGQGPGLTPRTVGDSGGQAAVSLSASQIPAHSHALGAALSPSSGTPASDVSLAPLAGGAVAYRVPANRVNMDAATIGASGGSAPHNNRQPYLALNFIIALQGIFPARN
jgi:microcystin-dependent protein